MNPHQAQVVVSIIRSLPDRDDNELLKLERVYALRSSTSDRRIASAIQAELDRRTS